MNHESARADTSTLEAGQSVNVGGSIELIKSPAASKPTLARRAIAGSAQVFLTTLQVINAVIDLVFVLLILLALAIACVPQVRDSLTEIVLSWIS